MCCTFKKVSCKNFILGIFRGNIWGKKDCDACNQPPRICQNAKNCSKQTNKQQKNIYIYILIGVFWAVGLKYYCHIWNKVLTNTVHFGIGCVFCKGPGSAFSKDLYFLKVRFIKYSIWCLTLEVYLEPNRASSMELIFENSWQLLTINYFLIKPPS